MGTRVATAVCLCCVVAPAMSRAQTLSPAPPVLKAPSAESFWAPFKAVPADFSQFFSLDTAKIVTVASAGAFATHRWDTQGTGMALARFKPAGAFAPGNIGGGVYAQVGGSFALYTIGKVSHSAKVAAVGGDLLRAQLLTQGMVQAMKFTTRRTRPDSSNALSLPSGHTAGAMATATVLQRHFGWRVGGPAYAFGTYVAASRMAANKHHLSDLVVGAAIGIAAGRTVTVGRGAHQFEVGLGPTVGGAAVTFTKK